MTTAGVVLAAASTAALLATAAAAQGGPPEPLQPSQGGDRATVPPPALVEPAVAPSEPSAAQAAFSPRTEIQCADFRAGPGATWRALASVSLPGPQGPVRVSAGQVVSPGVYVSGLDLAAILQARCF